MSEGYHGEGERWQTDLEFLLLREDRDRSHVPLFPLLHPILQIHEIHSGPLPSRNVPGPLFRSLVVLDDKWFPTRIRQGNEQPRGSTHRYGKSHLFQRLHGVGSVSPV